MAVLGLSDDMASKIDVILLDDVKHLGQSGELAEVKLGYARNWLLPQGLVAIADASAMTGYAKRKAKLESTAKQRRDDAEKIKLDLQDKLDAGKSVLIKSRAGESGKLFGSITKETLAEEISRQFDHKISKSQISVKEPIRNVGDFEITVNLSSGIESIVRVRVEAA